MNLFPSIAMKLRISAFVLLAVALNSAPARAADLNQIIPAAAKYESGLSREPLQQLEELVRSSAGNPAQRKELEAGLIKLLAPTSTFEARRFACLTLAVVGTEASHPALAELLKSDDTVGIACFALGPQPSPKASEVLRTALPTARGACRMHIINTLGDRADADAVKLLADFTRSPDDLITDAAISALGKIATPAALTQLAELRQKGDPALARAAVAATLQAADKIALTGDTKTASGLYEELSAAAQAPFVRRAAVAGLLRLEKEATARILDILRGQDSAAKPVAIAAIRSLQPADTSAKFAKELPKLQPADQVLMIEALAARGDAAAKTAVNENLTAENTVVRLAAVSALGTVGDESSVPALAKALIAGKTPDETQPVEQALNTLRGGVKVDENLVAEMKKAPADSKARFIAILAKRANRVAIPALLDLTSDEAAAKPAFRALGKLATDQDLPALLDKLVNLKVADARGEAEGAVAKAISKTADETKRSDAVSAALAKTSNVEARCALLSLFPTCGGAKALAAVKSARADQEPRVREAALRALADWPDASATDTLLEAAQAATADTDRVLALRGTVRLLGTASDFTPQDVAARFQKAMTLAKNADEKKLLLGGLANVHDPVALKLVEPYLSEKEVQAEAAQAAVSLAPSLCGASRDATKSALQKVMELPVDKDLQQSALNMLDVIKNFADFITAWQVAGPFTQEGKTGKELIDVAFSPEQNGAPGVKWQLMPAGTDKASPWLLDLGKLYGGNDRVAYVRAWVHSDTQQPAQLELGSDDGIKAWFNGKVVVTANRGGAVKPGDQKAPVTLQKGWNPVLLKVVQWSAGWGFCARVAKPDGTALPGIRIEAFPPK